MLQFYSFSNNSYQCTAKSSISLSDAQSPSQSHLQVMQNDCRHLIGLVGTKLPIMHSDNTVLGQLIKEDLSAFKPILRNKMLKRN